ncbi:MAG: thiol-disulfide oxidoreductase DCC family protein [Phycisphaerales bacterium JB040]
MTGLPANHPPVVLYDGHCAFCDAGVQWLLRRDREGVLRFASLQSEAGGALLDRLSIPNDMSTMVLVEDGEAHLRSRAGLRTLRHLGWPWRALSWARVLPRWLTDPVYRLIARHRYRLSGRRDACRMPDPEIRNRFLDSAEDLRVLEG